VRAAPTTRDLKSLGNFTQIHPTLRIAWTRLAAPPPCHLAGQTKELGQEQPIFPQIITAGAFTHMLAVRPVNNLQN